MKSLAELKKNKRRRGCKETGRVYKSHDRRNKSRYA